MANPYPRFLTSGYFDAFSWVPTIQGNLFTKVLNTDSFDGQIDKHLVNFEFDNRTRPANNSRHIVGTFLIADIDRKPWPNPYSGVFRYILRGSINSGTDSNEFYNSLPENLKGSDIKELVENSFVGELTILHNEYPDLPRLESEFLEQIRKTETLNVEYDTARNDTAENIQGVNARRRLLNDSYMLLVNKVQEIEDQENDRFYRNDFPDIELKSNPYRIWRFKILLSEDGLLLIKNNTVRAFNKYISFTYSQYKKLPRPYKLAVVRVKHIFHKHYHHDAKNDTCITLSDTKIGKTPAEIATEQIRGLLLEIVKSKRNENFAHIRTNGVIAYTNSLLKIFVNNKLISTAESDAIDFLDNIKEDAEQIEDEMKNTLGFLVAQGKAIVILVWYIPIVTFGILVSQFIFDDTTNTGSVKFFTFLISILAASLARSLALNRVKSKIYIQTHFLIKTGDRFRKKKFQTNEGSYSRPFVRYLVRQNKKRIRWEKIERRFKALRIYYLRSKFEIFKWSFFLLLAILLSLIIAFNMLDSLLGL